MPPQADRNYGRPKIVQGFACYLRVGPQPSLSDFKERLETAASAYGAAESMLKAFSRREAERVTAACRDPHTAKKRKPMK